MQLEKVYLKPGELVVTVEPVRVTTVLGSCVSVTMFHAQTGAASICHAMLPGGRDSENLKFVDTAVRCMMRFFGARKIAPHEIEVKIFGGADMFGGGQLGRGLSTVGHQNLVAAQALLDGFGLVPIASDVGGRKGRKLIFNTHDGSVLIKKMLEQG